MSGYGDVLRECSRLTGKVAMVGVRAHKDDWWAHCDGIEWDGPTAAKAARSVLHSIQQREASKLAKAEAEAKRLREVLS